MAKHNDIVHPAASVVSTMGAIADGAMTPIVKSESRTTEEQAGRLLAGDIIKRATHEGAGWAPIGYALARGTAEFRAGVVAGMKAHTTLEHAHAVVSQVDPDRAKAQQKSANVRISQCATICAAFSSTGTIDGAVAWAGGPKAEKGKPDALSFADWHSYAVSIRGSAAGRKPDSVAVALGKWVKRVTEDTKRELSAEDRKVLASVTEILRQFDPE